MIRLKLPALLLALVALLCGRGTAEDAWRFKPFTTHKTSRCELYEIHVTDDVGKIDLVVTPIGALTRPGTLELEVLECSDAGPNHFQLSERSKAYGADTPSLTFPIRIQRSKTWYRAVWLWVRIKDPLRKNNLAGGTALIGIRPSNKVKPPTIAFQAEESTLAAGQTGAIRIELSAPCGEPVAVHYRLAPDSSESLRLPVSGEAFLPAGSTRFDLSVDAREAKAGDKLSFSLFYENADGSDTNLFFGNHSWKHTHAPALETDGLLSFHSPGDRQGFFTGGWHDRGFESAEMLQTAEKPLLHFDGSGPVPGLVVASDAVDRETGEWYNPYVRCDAKLASVGGPKAFNPMNHYQELVVYIGEFRGEDAWRNTDQFTFTIRARTADLSRVVYVKRGKRNKQDPNREFLVDGIWWSIVGTNNIHPSDDEIFITSVDYQDGQGPRPVFVFRHHSDPEHTYLDKGKRKREKPDNIGNPLLFISKFKPGAKKVFGRGSLLYGVSYRTFDADHSPMGKPVPDFWPRPGLWPEPRGNARMDMGKILRHTVTVVP